ncbi:hypothetical protein [Bacillus subtilis]|uniref:hypothetical protein n=1 Tax=Bacillus subtilis TaxID=1423 RepID=UPI003F762D28
MYRPIWRWPADLYFFCPERHYPARPAIFSVRLSANENGDHKTPFPSGKAALHKKRKRMNLSRKHEVKNMNIGDVMFQLFVFIIFAAVVFAAVTGFKYAKNRKAQLDRIEKKLNSLSEDHD